MTGRRVAVVGASSGLGRCIALGLARQGHRVALLARREDRLTEALTHLPPGSLAVRCDVTDETGCAAALSEAIAGLGGLDTLIYSVARFPVGPLARTDAATWDGVLATNVTGAAVATRAVLDALAQSRGTAVYLSSISSTVTPPWPYLGAYVASKAALNAMVGTWRVEHPEVGFTVLNVGECVGGDGYSATEAMNDVDPDFLTHALTTWLATGALSGNLVTADDLIASVAGLLGYGPSVVPARVDLMPRAGAGSVITRGRS